MVPGMVLTEDSNGTRNGSDRGLKWYQRAQMVPGTVLDREHQVAGIFCAYS